MDIQNNRIPDSEFYALRQEVLTQWPTGKDVDLEEAIAYHRENILLEKYANAVAVTRSEYEAAIAAAEEAIKAQEAILANDQIVWRNVVEYKEALIAELKANIEKYTAQVELYTKLVEDAKAALDAAMSAADAE